MIRTLAVLMLALTLGACAGTKFERVSNTSLTLNGTTEQEIVGNLGQPYSVTTTTENDKQIRLIIYSYASSLTGAGLIAGVPSSRSQSFSFYNDKLVGYQYSSNFLADITRFDEGMALSFKEGVTTRDDVVKKLGPPTGESVYPLVDDPADRAIGYAFSYLDTRPAKFILESQSLKLVFGPDDVAKKITYTKSGPS